MIEKPFCAVTHYRESAGANSTSIFHMGKTKEALVDAVNKWLEDRLHKGLYDVRTEFGKLSVEYEVAKTYNFTPVNQIDFDKVEI